MHGRAEQYPHVKALKNFFDWSTLFLSSHISSWSRVNKSIEDRERAEGYHKQDKCKETLLYAGVPDPDAPLTLQIQIGDGLLSHPNFIFFNYFAIFLFTTCFFHICNLGKIYFKIVCPDISSRLWCLSI